MALIKVGNGVIDIRGSLGGTYFTRDKTGLHCTAKPRRVRQRSSLQDRQRRAFAEARAFSKINRTVSYNIYRSLSNLPMAEPPLEYPPIK